MVCFCFFFFIVSPFLVSSFKTSFQFYYGVQHFFFICILFSMRAKGYNWLETILNSVYFYIFFFILGQLSDAKRKKKKRTHLKFGTPVACIGGGTLYGKGSFAATAGFSNNILLLPFKIKIFLEIILKSFWVYFYHSNTK